MNILWILLGLVNRAHNDLCTFQQILISHWLFAFLVCSTLQMDLSRRMELVASGLLKDLDSLQQHESFSILHVERFMSGSEASFVMKLCETGHS